MRQIVEEEEEGEEVGREKGPVKGLNSQTKTSENFYSNDKNNISVHYVYVCTCTTHITGYSMQLQHTHTHTHTHTHMHTQTAQNSLVTCIIHFIIIFDIMMDDVTA